MKRRRHWRLSLRQARVLLVCLACLIPTGALVTAVVRGGLLAEEVSRALRSGFQVGRFSLLYVRTGNGTRIFIWRVKR